MSFEDMWPNYKETVLEYPAGSYCELPNRIRYIYFVQAETGEIKIGSTFNVKQRIRQIQIDCPCKVKKLLQLNSKQMSEYEVHIKFKQYRKQGEWFYPHQDILDFVQEAKWTKKSLSVAGTLPNISHSAMQHLDRKYISSKNLE